MTYGQLFSSSTNLRFFENEKGLYWLPQNTIFNSELSAEQAVVYLAGTVVIGFFWPKQYPSLIHLPASSAVELKNITHILNWLDLPFIFLQLDHNALFKNDTFMQDWSAIGRGHWRGGRKQLLIGLGRATLCWLVGRWQLAKKIWRWEWSFWRRQKNKSL